MAVLAAVREREARRIRESRRRAVDHFSDERQRLQRPRTELLDQQQRREVAQVALVGDGQDRAEPLRVDVVRADVMMMRKDEVSRLPQRPIGILARQRKHRVLGGHRVAIHQVLNHPLVLTDDGRVRRGGEVADRCRVPVVPARRPLRLVQSLLHDGPLAVGGHDERVEIDLKAVRNRVVVHPCGETAGLDRALAVETEPIGERA